MNKEYQVKDIDVVKKSFILKLLIDFQFITDVWDRQCRNTNL